MIIIISLGNPGKKFERTRHNAGFEAADFLAAKYEFPEFAFNKKYNALLTEKSDVILVKPQTFMNESGSTVKKLTKTYPPVGGAGNSKANTYVVVHDDMDVPLGKIKVSKASGAGGHKGVDSIITALGTKEFMRIKIGVEIDPAQKAEDVVLKKFTKEQYEKLQSVFPEVAKTLEAIE